MSVAAIKSGAILLVVYEDASAGNMWTPCCVVQCCSVDYVNGGRNAL